jgi:hypothetical protein
MASIYLSQLFILIFKNWHYKIMKMLISYLVVVYKNKYCIVPNPKAYGFWVFLAALGL